ncbi:MAG: hypothetical protein ACXADB_06650 [Candidatus Hermodarchaeia archaeon]
MNSKEETSLKATVINVILPIGEAEMINVTDIPTWQEYDEMTDKCPRCQTTLGRLQEWHPHEGGWQVKGYPYKMWLYKRCGKCQHDWGYQHLRIPRPYPPIERD